MSTNWLTYVNLSDEYERRARLLPALLTLLSLVPIAFIARLPLLEGILSIMKGVGVAAVLSVGLSHVASAFGNRIQTKLWPRWPYDSPTNKWLRPDDTCRSKQQKELWYAAIQRLTSLDIPRASTDTQELDRTINDAVARLRNQLWKSSHSARMNIHNVDYGFVRNLTGLRPVWLTGAAVGAGLAWYRYLRVGPGLDTAILLSAYLLLLVLLAYVVLPRYTRQRADHYAESFFAAVMSLDDSDAMKGKDIS